MLLGRLSLLDPVPMIESHDRSSILAVSLLRPLDPDEVVKEPGYSVGSTYSMGNDQSGVSSHVEPEPSS